MANYAVTDHVTIASSPEAVAALMETYIETVDATKTIRMMEMVTVGNGIVQGVIIHDA